MARLILTLNNKVLSSHKVALGQQVSIGRHPDNYICIDHMSVSAHHASVRADEQKLILIDLGSRNGTFVNDEQVQECQLAHQDWITIGKHICIVDLYESLSFEATENELKARTTLAPHAEQTMFLDRDQVQHGWLGFDYLSFLEGGQEDLELADSKVMIGRNKDAQIKISGFWAIMAGEPSATITRLLDDYVLEHVGGILKPKVNGTVIQKPTKLNHEDVVKVGPVAVQIRCVRRPSK